MNDGSTVFIRCASCHTMYRAEEGLNFATGKSSPCWFKPKPIRVPIKCDHNGNAECWNGTEWVLAEIKQASA